MPTTDYVDFDRLKTTLTLDSVVFLDEDLQQALTAASRGIDEACFRRFYPDDNADNERFYTPRGIGSLNIDDLIELTALDVDVDGDGVFEQSWEENVDFFLDPLNAPADGKPWERIVANQRGGRHWPRYHRAVRVTGKFGWAAPPADIVQATGLLASRLLRRAREAPFGGIVAVAAETAVALTITRTDPDVAGLIDPYIRETLFV